MLYSVMVGNSKQRICLRWPWTTRQKWGLSVYTETQEVLGLFSRQALKKRKEKMYWALVTRSALNRAGLINGQRPNCIIFCINLTAWACAKSHQIFIKKWINMLDSTPYIDQKTGIARAHSRNNVESRVKTQGFLGWRPTYPFALTSKIGSVFLSTNQLHGGHVD